MAWLSIISFLLSTVLTSATKPNIIFLLADDLGFNDVSYHGKTGHSAILTPTIDELARTGVTLENYYVQPICTPTRSQLMSGRYQIHTGLMHSVIQPPNPACLPTDEVTLPQKLKESGYATHMVGKWHLGFSKPSCLPNNRGFDSFFGFYLGEQDYYTHSRCITINETSMCGFDYYNGTKPARQYDGIYSLYTFVDEVNRILEAHDKTQPIFMYVPFQNVHIPLQAPKKYPDLYNSSIKSQKRRQYAGMVSALDEAVKNITVTLKETGLYNNSVIIFSTDNGGPIGCANNWPLRGSKGSLWEGGVHGVGLVHSPLLSEDVVGTINRELIHVSDWFPTLVAGVAGGSLNGTKPLDGFNVWETIKYGNPSPRQELLHNIDPLTGGRAVWPRVDCYDESSEDSSYDVVKGSEEMKKFSTNMQSALRVGDWKILTGTVWPKHQWFPPPESGITPILPIWNKTQTVFLFNIAQDPLEKYDLSRTRPDIVELLISKLEKYWDTSVPVIFPDADPKANPKYHDGLWGPWRED